MTPNPKGKYFWDNQCYPPPPILYFLKNVIPYFGERSIQTKYIVMITKEYYIVFHNCKFRDPRSRGSCAGALPYKSYSEYALFL